MVSILFYSFHPILTQTTLVESPVALLDALNGSGSAAADAAGTEGAPALQFGSSTCKGKSGSGSGSGSGGSGVYFAEQPSSAWQRCDAGMDVHTRAMFILPMIVYVSYLSLCSFYEYVYAPDTQGLLQENDSSLQFRRMLQRLARSKAGLLIEKLNLSAVGVSYHLIHSFFIPYRQVFVHQFVTTGCGCRNNCRERQPGCS